MYIKLRTKVQAVFVDRRARTERAAEAMANSVDDVVVPMESLGTAYRRLAGNMFTPEFLDLC